MAFKDDLVAYWKLDEESGIRYDAHGSNDLSDNNTVLYDTGVIGNAADFETANDESLSIADNADLSFGDEDFTVTGWYKAEDSVQSYLMSKWSDAAGQYEYRLIYNASRFQFWVSQDGTNYTLVSADNLGAPSTGILYFIVCWHDATANTINIQVNNGAIDSEAHSTGCHDGTTAFYLGSSAKLADHWDGLIDEVGVWGRVLTADERTILYNGGYGYTYDYWDNGFAEGGTITESGGKQIHTFRDSSLFVPSKSLNVDYLIVAGGGGGGDAPAGIGGGGGGAGGVIEDDTALITDVYPVVVGAGGGEDDNGDDSTFAGDTADGGGGGGEDGNVGTAGGSGGGGGSNSTGGAGTGGQGHAGGDADGIGHAGGGGGWGEVGYQANDPDAGGGAGGDGVQSSISGAAVYYAGGGGGGFGTPVGSQGGGGRGATGVADGADGADGLGGGGGGGYNTKNAGSGGKGIVIVSYTPLILRAVAGALDFIGTLARSATYPRPAAGVLDLAGSVSRVTSFIRSTAGSIDFSGALIAGRLLPRAISGAIDFAGTLTKLVLFKRSAAGALDLAGGVTYKVFGILNVLARLVTNPIAAVLHKAAPTADIEIDESPEGRIRSR